MCPLQNHSCRSLFYAQALRNSIRSLRSLAVFTATAPIAVSPANSLGAFRKASKFSYVHFYMALRASPEVYYMLPLAIGFPKIPRILMAWHWMHIVLNRRYPLSESPYISESLFSFFGPAILWFYWCYFSFIL